ncbi:nitroreductase family protein [Entamoeba histolytica HM-1:IMSS-B]|uniref:Nitroreductase family protein n=6 Tax=Entamoeba histolytica TaxID=5759 RepID=C4M3G7_ENTH1|nr:nitroreductase family protein [Entamoeba histolytica HM-1:IMSS]EMD47017.1 nitroreductase family protein [Entamoeba histolytica KU27]EMH75029.1 nitroreductase family protein [Entamoeba histolytica HM-1:IMSS-B]EMS14998.1 nitroreductase family protein [Entamoeba histolytica HM-3:IMSS]ENY62383.1 nitroreductase family protein, putative [Entamoeba histolytica HM-1:IMSS-A]GAT95848.1 nitroreductase family protein [Entamoeba histolytica]|eukprot:XP_652242.1 nitroreductase family protein [Entamoeba histolytica HM-1:IMSS]
MKSLYRRTCRKFIQKEVEENKLSHIIDAGRNAPTAYDEQPIRFYVIKNKQVIARIAENCQETIFNLNPKLYEERMKTLGVKSILTYDCPCAIILTCDKSNDNTNTHFDVGFIAQNMLLAANIEGLAAVPIGVITVVADKWLDALHLKTKIKKEEELLLMIAIGYGDEDYLSTMEPKELKSKVVYH